MNDQCKRTWLLHCLKESNANCLQIIILIIGNCLIISTLHPLSQCYSNNYQQGWERSIITHSSDLCRLQLLLYALIRIASYSKQLMINYSFTSLILLASFFKPISSNTDTRILQDPPSLSHSLNMRQLISSEFLPSSFSKAPMRAPVLSSKRWIPNLKYLAPISLGKLTFLPLSKEKLIISMRVGTERSIVRKQEIKILLLTLNIKCMSYNL